jgi:hypothetical protein
MSVLPVQATCVLGASYASYPNPVGEKVYRPHLLVEMLPIAVIACALLLAGLIHAIQRKAKRLAPDQGESHQG